MICSRAKEKSCAPVFLCWLTSNERPLPADSAHWQDTEEDDDINRHWLWSSQVNTHSPTLFLILRSWWFYSITTSKERWWWYRALNQVPREEQEDNVYNGGGGGNLASSSFWLSSINRRLIEENKRSWLNPNVFPPPPVERNLCVCWLQSWTAALMRSRK